MENIADRLIEIADVPDNQIETLVEIHRLAGPGTVEIADCLQEALRGIPEPLLADVVRAISVSYLSVMKNILTNQVEGLDGLSRDEINTLILLSTSMVIKHMDAVDDQNIH